MSLSLLETYRDIIFYNENIKENFFQRLKNTVYKENDFEATFANFITQANDKDIQIHLAPYLRELAVHQLETSTTEVPKAFRQRYSDLMTELQEAQETIEHFTPSLEAFYQQHRRHGEYGTDVLAIALAEKFEINFACTHINNHSKRYLQLHKVPQEDAYTVHLYNQNNVHFYVRQNESGSTIGDGNCMYNGFAQVLQQIVLLDLHKKEQLKATAEQLKKIANFHLLQTSLQKQNQQAPCHSLNDTITQLLDSLKSDPRVQLEIIGNLLKIKLDKLGTYVEQRGEPELALYYRSLKEDIGQLDASTNMTEKGYEDFKKAFLVKLHAKDPFINSKAKQLIANIAIILTGVGALFLATHLIHSKLTAGQPTLFFQKSLDAHLDRQEQMNQTEQPLKRKITL